MISRPHGLRGTLRLRLHDPASTVADDADDLLLRLPDGRLLEGLHAVGRTPGALLVRHARFADRQSAEALRGCRVLRPRDAYPLAEDEYLVADLVGCSVGEGDRDYGRVVEVFSAGASDVLVIHDERWERLVPLVEQWVGDVDLESRHIELRDGESWEPHPLSAGEKRRRR